MNLILNSLALCFIFELDDHLSPDLPTAGFFRVCREDSKAARHVRVTRASREALRSCVANYTDAPHRVASSSARVEEAFDGLTMCLT